MKRHTILPLIAAILSIASFDALALSSRQPKPLTTEQMAAVQQGQYISGGEQTGAGLWQGSTMKAALESSKVTDANGELIAAITFGEDIAPDAPVADTSAIEGKNALDQAIKAFAASKSPQAAGIAALLTEAGKASANLTKPQPQGDRKGAQGVFVFRGESADAQAYGDSLNQAIAAIRGKTVPRANAAQTTIRTEKSEYTDIAVSNIVAGVTALGEMYFSTEALRIAAEEYETAIDPVTSAPIPTPVVDNGDGTVSATSQEGDQNLLVKPVGNHGGIVILLPAKFNNTITSVTLAGKPLKFSAVANGNRSHWRGDKCSTYGDNAKLVFVSSGTPITVNVASPCTRWQTTVSKPVSASSIMPESPAASTKSTGVAAAPGE
mgnify:FL=1